MRISDWSSDVCSSDLAVTLQLAGRRHQMNMWRIGRAHGDGQVHRGDDGNVALAAQALKRERTNIVPAAMQAIRIGKAQRDHHQEILELVARLLPIFFAEQLRVEELVV